MVIPVPFPVPSSPSQQRLRSFASFLGLPYMQNTLSRRGFAINMCGDPDVADNGKHFELADTIFFNHNVFNYDTGSLRKFGTVITGSELKIS